MHEFLVKALKKKIFQGSFDTFMQQFMQELLEARGIPAGVSNESKISEGILDEIPVETHRKIFK